MIQNLNEWLSSDIADQQANDDPVILESLQLKVCSRWRQIEQSVYSSGQIKHIVPLGQSCFSLIQPKHYNTLSK